MDPAPSTPATPHPAVLAVWPRSSQLATALLIGLTVLLLIGRGLAYHGWGSKPTELRHESRHVYRIDLNEAGRAELLQLPGVGATLAGRILNYRQDHGGFASVEELARVPGIGPATVERLRPWVCVRPNDSAEEETETAMPATPSIKGPTSLSKEVGAKKAANLTGLINVNHASAAELQRLPGIGPTLSQRIVEERRKGPFKSVEDLRRVSGIGPKTVERLRNYITVDAGPVQVTRGED